MDSVLEDNEVFAAHLTALRIAHTFVVVPGVGHQTLPLLEGLGEDGWAFYREALPEMRGLPTTGGVR
jgi:hypothetical protein